MNARVFAKVIEYCKYHAGVVAGGDAPSKREISDWDAAFMLVDQGTLFEITLAAQYLDIGELLDLTCLTVANMIKGTIAQNS